MPSLEAEGTLIDYEQFKELMATLNLVCLDRMTPTESNLLNEVW